jgi:hypothetical protein
MQMSFQPQLCPDPIFIIGSPRSGTSILAWSLAHHNQLWTSKEAHILYELFGEGYLEEALQRAKFRPDGSWLQEEGVEKGEFLYYLGLGLNALYTSRSRGRRWIEQTPSYTMIADLLIDMFPGALFLHALRDGRRVVNSMINFANRYADGLGANYARSGLLPQWATADFREACKTWSMFVESSMEFCVRNPTRCLTVVNEELVVNPHKGFREICSFLCIPYNTQPARFFHSARINSSYQINESFPTLDIQDPLMGKAFIMATPNPVPIGAGKGTTTISWSTGDGSWGQVYVSINGQSEELFTEGAESVADARWIDPNTIYEFRLYAGTEHTNMLDRTVVRQGDSRTQGDLDFEANTAQRTMSRKLPETWKDWTAEQRMIFYEEAGGTLLKARLATEDELMCFLHKSNR